MFVLDINQPWSGLEVAAGFFRVGNPASESGQVVLIPSLGFEQIEGVFGVIPDVEEEGEDSLLGSGEGDAIGETGKIFWFEIGRQV